MESDGESYSRPSAALQLVNITIATLHVAALRRAL